MSDCSAQTQVGSCGTFSAQKATGFTVTTAPFRIGPEPKNVGYIFRRGKDEVVLFGFMRWRFEGTYNGQNAGGSLEEKPSDRVDEWKRQFAKPELGIKMRS